MSRCGCSDPGVLGCVCNLVSTGCVAVSGEGSAADPYVLDPILSTSFPDQMLACTSSGLRATYDDTQPDAYVSRDANISLANNTEAAFAFNLVFYDPFGMWSVANPTRLTAQQAGLYMVSAQSEFSGFGVGLRRLHVRTSGTNRRVEHGIVGGSIFVTSVPIAGLVRLGVGDYVEITNIQVSGSTIDVKTFCRIVRVGGF